MHVCIIIAYCPYNNTIPWRQAVQYIYIFMSENVCTMVDLFDKAVAEGASNHCGNEVGSSLRVAPSVKDETSMQ